MASATAITNASSPKEEGIGKTVDLPAASEEQHPRTPTPRKNEENSEDDDDPLELPADTMAYLQSFLAERKAQEEKFAAIAARVERQHQEMMKHDEADQLETKRQDEAEGVVNDADEIPQEALTMDLFTEDWQMSQFWYDKPTRGALAYTISFKGSNFRLPDTLPSGEPTPINIAIVSAPSVFSHLLLLQKQGLISSHIHPILLEYDPRFTVFNPPPGSSKPQRFYIYDYNYPIRLPPHLHNAFDVVLVDPPFLSEDCQTGAAVTVRWLLRKDGEGKVVVCTGERMARVVERLYKKEGVRETDFAVGHEKGLGNEFRCLASWEVEGRWRWVEREGEAEEA